MLASFISLIVMSIGFGMQGTLTVQSWHRGEPFGVRLVLAMIFAFSATTMAITMLPHIK